LLEEATDETRRLESPWRFAVDNHVVVPAAIFSVATPDNYRSIFFFELDLSDHGHKAYRAKTELYRDLIFRGIYKQHLNVTQRAVVATLTTVPRRERNIAAFCENNGPFYFKTVPEYGIAEITPPPSISKCSTAGIGRANPSPST
jgi:hypothetical protein